jgi:hypothetical protein
MIPNSSEQLLSSGDVLKVTERVDARYDWLPSPHTLANKHKSLKLKYYGDACESRKDHVQRESKKTYKNKENVKNTKQKKGVGRLALVSASGNCSLFRKVCPPYKLKCFTVI